MYVPFENLSEQSRLWIYQADRRFSAPEEELVREAVQSFCEQWAAHGNPLKTSYKIDRSQFLILAVDEDINSASGCSIDGSVYVLKSLKQQTGIDFLDRSKAAFLIEDRVRLIPLSELQRSFSSGILGPATTTFHLQAATKGVWEREWMKPAEKTWLTQYIPKTPVA